MNLINNTIPLISNLTEALPRLQRLADKMVRQTNLKGIVAGVIGLALDYLKVFIRHIKLGTGNLHLTARHRLTEEVIRLNLPFTSCPAGNSCGHW